ncbi:MAG: hypothetical protein J4G18_02845 [Anaerolineae bacterium]|nr:hypothetical protein [Anaerolineae bacterium]
MDRATLSRFLLQDKVRVIFLPRNPVLGILDFLIQRRGVFCFNAVADLNARLGSARSQPFDQISR